MYLFSLFLQWHCFASEIKIILNIPRRTYGTCDRQNTPARLRTLSQEKRNRKTKKQVNWLSEGREASERRLGINKPQSTKPNFDRPIRSQAAAFKTFDLPKGISSIEVRSCLSDNSVVPSLQFSFNQRTNRCLKLN